MGKTENNMSSFERKILSMMISKPSCIAEIKLKPEYFEDLDFANIYVALTETFSDFGYIRTEEMLNKYKNINADLYFDVATEFGFESTYWKEELINLQREIIKNYKDNLATESTIAFKEGRITRSEMLKKMEEIDKIDELDTITYLTEDEIINTLTSQKTKVEFAKFGLLSRTLNLAQGDLLVIGAPTGGGKSAFLLNLLVDLCGEYQCIYFNLEMSKALMYKRLIGINSRVDIDDLDKQDVKTLEIIKRSAKALGNTNIVFEHQKCDIADIVATIVKCKDSRRHTVVFIDHIGLVKSKVGKSLYEQTTEVIKQLRQVCLSYDCTLIVASQLNRTSATQDLNISMLKDSGELENSARKVILLSQEDTKDMNPVVTMNAFVAKNDSGEKRVLKLQFDKRKQYFSEPLLGVKVA